MCLVAWFVDDDISNGRIWRCKGGHAALIEDGVIELCGLRVIDKAVIAQDVILRLESFLLLDSRKRGEVVLTDFRSRHGLLVDAKAINVDVCALWIDEDATRLLYSIDRLPEAIAITIDELTADDSIDEDSYIINALAIEVWHNVYCHMGTLVVTIDPVLRTLISGVQSHEASLLCF